MNATLPELPVTVFRGRSLVGALVLFVLAIGLYGLTGYGGVREVDGEVVYRVGQSLAHGRGFEVSSDIESWPGFGIAPGKNDRLYGVFGPLQSLVAAPFIRLAEEIDRDPWWATHHFDVPTSHFVGEGVNQYLAGERPDRIEPHAERFLVSNLNVLLTALLLVAFFALLRRLGAGVAAALFGGLLLGFGSLAWPYAATFFSEPLATLLVVVSLERLAAADPRFGGGGRAPLVVAGLALGLAVAAHITAILFVPFLAAWAGSAEGGSSGDRSGRFRRLVDFGVGLALPLALLALVNFVRFGNPLETGRGVDPGRAEDFRYGHAQWIGPGLSGLLWSGAKGFLWFAPAAVAGVLAWGAFARRQAGVAKLLLAAVAVRLLFIATRSDWHGGFCVGPRLMVQALPILLVPLALGFDDAIRRRRTTAIALLSALFLASAAEQAYLAVGEIYSYSYTVRQTAYRIGQDVFEGDRIYRDPKLSPLLHLHEGHRGPWVLRQVPVGNLGLWGLVSALVALLVALALAPFALDEWRRAPEPTVDEAPPTESPRRRRRKR